MRSLLADRSFEEYLLVWFLEDKFQHMNLGLGKVEIHIRCNYLLDFRYTSYMMCCNCCKLWLDYRLNKYLKGSSKMMRNIQGLNCWCRRSE